jgi:hypothetical protein
VARCGDRERCHEPVGPLVADRPAERLGSMVPVEQLDRGREAAHAPADRGGAVGHEADPLGVEHPEPSAGRAEPLVERRPAPGAPDVRPTGQRPPGPDDAPGAIEDEAYLDLELGPARAILGLFPSLTQTVARRGPSGPRIGWSPRIASVSAATAAAIR